MGQRRAIVHDIWDTAGEAWYRNKEVNEGILAHSVSSKSAQRRARYEQNTTLRGCKGGGNKEHCAEGQPLNCSGVRRSAKRSVWQGLSATHTGLWLWKLNPNIWWYWWDRAEFWAMGNSKVGTAQSGIVLGLKMTEIVRTICWYYPFVAAVKKGGAIKWSLLQWDK